VDVHNRQIQLLLQDAEYRLLQNTLFLEDVELHNSSKQLHGQLWNTDYRQYGYFRYCGAPHLFKRVILIIITIPHIGIVYGLRFLEYVIQL